MKFLVTKRLSKLLTKQTCIVIVIFAVLLLQPVSESLSIFVNPCCCRLNQTLFWRTNKNNDVEIWPCRIDINSNVFVYFCVVIDFPISVHLFLMREQWFLFLTVCCVDVFVVDGVFIWTAAGS